MGTRRSLAWLLGSSGSCSGGRWSRNVASITSRLARSVVKPYGVPAPPTPPGSTAARAPACSPAAAALPSSLRSSSTALRAQHRHQSVPVQRRGKAHTLPGVRSRVAMQPRVLHTLRLLTRAKLPYSVCRERWHRTVRRRWWLARRGRRRGRGRCCRRWYRGRKCH